MVHQGRDGDKHLTFSCNVAQVIGLHIRWKICFLAEVNRLEFLIGWNDLDTFRPQFLHTSSLYFPQAYKFILKG